MKLNVLKERIQGCQLKEEYLEAFLLQGAYIEGIIKQLVDVWVFIQTEKNSEKTEDYTKFCNAVLKRTKRYGLYDQIEMLYDMGNINDVEKKKLHSYRESRNEVVHSLLTKIKEVNLTDELMESLKLGDEIMSTTQFTNIEKIIIDFESKEKNQEKRK